MKLKDLVANSLPRVRGKKKKPVGLANSPIPTPAGLPGCHQMVSGTTHASSRHHHPIPHQTNPLPLPSPVSAVLVTPTNETAALSSWLPSPGQDFETDQESTAATAGSVGSFSTFMPLESHGQGHTSKMNDVAVPDAVNRLGWQNAGIYKTINHPENKRTAVNWAASTEVVSSRVLMNQGQGPFRGGDEMTTACGRAPRLSGMVTSHSAEGISARLMSGRSGQDNFRMAASEYGGSVSSHMSAISESAVEAYSGSVPHQLQQYNPNYYQYHQHNVNNLHAHYHHHNHQHHHHYYHHHHHPVSSRGRSVLAQQLSFPHQQSRQHQDPSSTTTKQTTGRSYGGDGENVCSANTRAQSMKMTGNQLPEKHGIPLLTGKQESVGFFRKSFASFRRKSSKNNNNNLTEPNNYGKVAPLTRENLAASEQMRCSVCPYPDQGGLINSTSVPKTNAGVSGTDHRPVKPKRRGLRGFSRRKKDEKENMQPSADTQAISQPQQSRGCPALQCRGTATWHSNYKNQFYDVEEIDNHSMVVAVGQPVTDSPFPGACAKIWDRPRWRECSVDSCGSSSVAYAASSREGSCIRELDHTGFDSASLSGYESDFPRGRSKVRRSRSRIRTNPWLPSPNPAHGLIGGGEGREELRESREEMMINEDISEPSSSLYYRSAPITRSASFEHRRPSGSLFLGSSYLESRKNTSITEPNTEKVVVVKRCDSNLHQQQTAIEHSNRSQRPLTPAIDDMEGAMTMSLDRPAKATPPEVAKKPAWWNLARRGSKKELSKKATFVASASANSSETVSSSSNTSVNKDIPCHSSSHETTRNKSSIPAAHHVTDTSDKPNVMTAKNDLQPNALNDLNTSTLPQIQRTRPNSIVSPNSEFILLAGHLEQLANNISFEYEDPLETVLDNVSDRSEKTTGSVGESSALTDDDNFGSFNRKSKSTSEGSPQTPKSESQFAHKGGKLNLLTPESPSSTISECSTSGSASFNTNISGSSGNTKLSGTSSAYSPDSGVGGLGSVDGDDVISSSDAQSSLDRRDNSRADNTNIPEDKLDAYPSADYWTYNRAYCFSHGDSPSSFCHVCAGAIPKKKNVRQAAGAPPVPERRPLTLNFSLSSGEESSATVSESDIDNTHYQDYSVSLSSHKKTGSPLPKCKTENLGHSQSEARSKPNIPGKSCNSRSGIIMGARASLLDQYLVPPTRNSPIGSDFNTRSLDRGSLRSANITRMPKPSSAQVFQETSSDKLKVCSSMLSSTTSSNSKTGFGSVMDIDSVEDSFESEELPNERFVSKMVRTCHLDPAMILEANIRRVAVPPPVEDDDDDDGDDNDGGDGGYNKRNYAKDAAEKGSKLSIDDGDRVSQNNVDMVSVSEVSSLMEYSVSLHGGSGEGSNYGYGESDAKSLDASFDMSDACVQTEFCEDADAVGGDMSRWDDVDTLGTLEERALDPAESTRRWLLAGNMQDSADTGYASQSRNSRVFLDEDEAGITAFTQDNMSEVKRTQECKGRVDHSANDNLSSGHSSSDEKTPRNSACFEADDVASYFSNTANHQKPNSQSNSCAYLEEGPVLYKSVSSSGKGPNQYKDENKAVSSTVARSNERPAVPPKPKRRSNSVRSISPTKVDKIFTDIEQQFQDIFEQKPGGHCFDKLTGKNFDPKRLSSGSSDSTLGSVASADSSFSGGAPVGELFDVAARCREFESELSPTQTSDILPSDKSSQETNNNLSHNDRRAFPKPLDGVVSRRKCTKNSRSHKSTMKHGDDRKPNPVLVSSPAAEKADYLEFLRDVPLSRSNLKRPLFLVPGVGPIDLSCDENLGIFTDCSNESSHSESYSESCASSSVSSPSPLHIGKKLKFKSKSAKGSAEKDKLLSPSSHAGVKSSSRPEHCLNSKGSAASSRPITLKTRETVNSPSSKSVSCSPTVYGKKDPECWTEHGRTINAGNKKKDIENQLNKLFDFDNDDDILCSRDLSEMDEDTRALAERVMALKREKDDVSRKLQVAQLDELTRKGNLKVFRKHAQPEYREALLSSLRELRDKLEEQKRKLQNREEATSACGDASRSQ